jgi:hypothetical protein
VPDLVVTRADYATALRCQVLQMRDCPPTLSNNGRGAPKPTITALAQATLPCRSTVSSPKTHHLTIPPLPSLLPHSTRVDFGVYTLSSGAHPFRECGPTTPPHRKRNGRKRRPLWVCRPHGPRLGFILCGSVIYRALTFFYKKTLLKVSYRKVRYSMVPKPR